MAKKIVIFGAGGFGREVLQIILAINADKNNEPEWNPLGFIVEEAYVTDGKVAGLPILGSIEWLNSNPDVMLVVAIGSPKERRRIVQRIEKISNNRFAVLIHPGASLGQNVYVEPGSIICSGALITTDIKIGKHVHVNIGSTIGHDAVLRDYATLNPSVNISGNVEISIGGEIGTGSILLPHTKIGEWSIVGAGSVVTKSFPADITAVGVPAKIIKQRLSGWQDIS